MNKTILALSLGLLLSATAGAATNKFNKSGLAPGQHGVESVAVNVQGQISQMDNNTPATGSSVACGSNTLGYTAENHYWRRFYLNEYPQGAPGANGTVTSVDVGVESSTNAVMTVNLYTTAHSNPVDTITVASLTLIGTATAAANGDLLTINVPVAGAIDNTATKDLVVEITTPDYSTSSPAKKFYMGGNGTAQTHKSFLNAASCGITNPTDPTTLGSFPNAHWTIVVKGTNLPVQLQQFQID